MYWAAPAKTLMSPINLAATSGLRGSNKPVPSYCNWGRGRFVEHSAQVSLCKASITHLASKVTPFSCVHQTAVKLSNTRFSDASALGHQQSWAAVSIYLVWNLNFANRVYFPTSQQTDPYPQCLNAVYSLKTTRENEEVGQGLSG